MKYVINSESIAIILYFVKNLFINLGTYYIWEKIINEKFLKLKSLKVGLLIFFVTILEIFAIIKGNFISGIVVFIACLTLIMKKDIINTKNYSVAVTILAWGISNSIFFIAVTASSIPNLLLKISNDSVAFVFISIIYTLIMHWAMNIKKLKNGLIFLNEKLQNEFFDVLMINLGAILLFLITILKNSELLLARQITIAILTLSILMFLTIQKSFQVYYKQKLLIQELNETKKDLKNKTEEVQKLEQENLNFSKKSHSLAHKQKSLEYKLNQLLLKTEISDEKELKNQIQKVSKELYSKPVMELDKTGITKIDDMLNFMQSECIKNNIDFNLQLSGNIYYIINNIITVEELEILLADHIKDAIIAIKHTNNVNKSVLVRLGKIEECYGLYIYDSGIEFEKETLENLGKKPSTTHKDEGGTGMGFMNTFDTLKKCQGSLIINEIGEPSKDNYTKIIMIKFDNKNEFKVISYKAYKN